MIATQGYGRQVEWKRYINGTRADVNKLWSGASTALTISGIFGPAMGLFGHSGPRSEERRRGQREELQALGHSGWFCWRTRNNIRSHTSRPTLRTRPVPMQFTSPHPAPDWRYAARASDDLALQRAPSRVPHTSPAQPYPSPALLASPILHRLTSDPGPQSLVLQRHPTDVPQRSHKSQIRWRQNIL